VDKNVGGDIRQLLTARALAKALAVSESTVRRMVRDKEVPVIRVRGLLRFDLGAVVRGLAAPD
jgi:excisionase family DNA binding protein